MKIFIDTASIEEIKEAIATGIIDGVTTNPSLIAKTGKKFEAVVKEIVAAVDGPISVETVSETASGMVEEAKRYSSFGKNVVMKIAMTEEGLKAVKTLTGMGIKTNVTLVFSCSQAMLAAKAGASYVSPFVGRLDDIGLDGMALVEEIVLAFSNYDIKTEVIVASIRNPTHFVRSALLGAHVATVPYSVIKQLAGHPLTDAGIKRFLDDWKRVPKEEK